MTNPDTGIEPDARPSDPAADGTGRRAGGLGAGLSQLLALALILALVGAGIFAVAQLRTHQHDNAQQSDTAAALYTARQFAYRMDNFKGTDLSAYRKNVTQLLTDRAKAEFDKSIPDIQQLYSKSKAVGKGEVRVAGVQSIDPDSATVLVVHDLLVTSSYGSQQQYLRWSVTLQKVNGKWLIDKFTQV